VLFCVTELGGAVQLMGIIRLLIDPENMLAVQMVRNQTLLTHVLQILCNE